MNERRKGKRKLSKILSNKVHSTPTRIKQIRKAKMRMKSKRENKEDKKYERTFESTKSTYSKEKNTAK